MPVRHDYDPKALQQARQREAAKPGRTKLAGRGAGCTPRVRKAIEALVFGIEGFEGSARDLESAAADLAGISVRSLRTARLKPAVMHFERQQLQFYRESQRAANLRTAVEIRDSVILKQTAAGQKVRLAAADQLDSDLHRGDTQVNVQINNTVKVTPGYVIRIDRSRDARPQQIDHLAKDGEIYEP